MEETLPHDVYFERQTARETENYDENLRQMKFQYDRIRLKFGSRPKCTNEELYSLASQCNRISNAFIGENISNPNPYEFATDLNKLLIKRRKEFINLFQVLGLDIKDVIEIREPKKTLKAAPKPNHTSLHDTTQKVRALYYHYLQETNYFPLFENHQSGKMAAIDEIATNYHISAKSFQSAYNGLVHPQNRINTINKENIEAVILLLADYPKALELAKNELKEVEMKR